MTLIEVTSLSQPGIEVFSTLTEAQLRNRVEPTKGIFIAESPKVIKVALDSGYQPVSLLCERRHLEGDAKEIIARCDDILSHAGYSCGITVYTGERNVLAELTGYTLTRCQAYRGD